MRLLLIFPPPASPTYVPLGLASLTAFLRTRTPELDLTVLDLNITTWQFYAKITPAGNDLLAFMHCHESFYDPVQYTRHQSTWADVNQRLQRLLAHARHYLNSGLWSDELQWFLDIVLQQIQTSSPNLLGFSVMFLEQMAPALALCRRLHETIDKHKRPHCVLGGAALSAVQIKDLMQYAWFLDAVLMGEGETALSQLCQGIPPDQIPGLITRTTEPRPLPSTQDIELTTLPIPDFRDLPLADYANPEPALPVVLSRHCAWARCRFCAHNVSFGSHRLKTINQFVQELEVLSARHHCRRFYLADQYVPTSVLMELTTALLQRPLEIMQWLQRRRWVGPVPFTEHLPCEHLLLYSAHRQAQDNHKPISPPAPKKVA